jgi:glycosyltransferase involved in cell wall biosynthesis
MNQKSSDLVKIDLPEVSICIPTYNGEQFIARTIQSVLNQTFTNFEVVISDDGSTDKTLEIIRLFNDPRIVRIHSLPKVGAEANWNNSVTNARAKLIKLVCQDDLLYPECLATEFETMAVNKDVAFCFSLRDFVTPKGRLIKGYRITNSAQKVVTKSQMLRKIVRSGGNPIGEPMAVMFRKDVFERAGKFHGDYVIDLNMWIELLDHGSALLIPHRLSAFRISKTSWTSSLKKSQFGSVRSLAKKVRKENQDSVSLLDLTRGQVAGLLRAPSRQIASQVILFFDRLFGAAR